MSSKTEFDEIDAAASGDQQMEDRLSEDTEGGSSEFDDDDDEDLTEDELDDCIEGDIDDLSVGSIDEANPRMRMSPYQADQHVHPFPGSYVTRTENPELPETVTLLTTEEGSKVYIVGTAHFSESSQEDVKQTIRNTQPDTVVVELCSSRINILRMDEESLLEEAQNINFQKVRQAIRQSGVLQGILHLLFLTMSAHITKQLGMAPGGEFRAALQEASKLDGCRVRLGDRPIQITLRRALSSLSLWQKTRLAWYLITSKEPISKEEVEKCKQKDLLEEMLREMTGEFPALSRVFVSERDLFLAEFLRNTATMLPNPNTDNGMMPSVTVAVVGLGHVRGIKDHWGEEINIHELMVIPPTSASERALKFSLRASLVALLSWGVYKVYTRFSHGIAF